MSAFGVGWTSWGCSFQSRLANVLRPSVQWRRGRGKAHKESNFSISACEYAAPTTRLDSRVGFLVGPFAGGGLRQKGGAELLSS